MKVNYLYTIVCLAALFYTGCKPKVAKDQELPAAAGATFATSTYLPDNDPDRQNALIFTNTTPGGFLSSWDFGGLKTSTKASDTMFFAYAGTYKVRLTTASKGGTSISEQDIVIANTSIYAASFTVNPLEGNKYEVVVTTPNTTANSFKFSDGQTSTQLRDTAYFPLVGKHSVSLTVTTSKGTSTYKQDIDVTTKDATYSLCQDQVITYLTGGCDAPDGKTWIPDPTPGRYVTGPKTDPTLTTRYNGKDGALAGGAFTKGLLTNEFNFNLNDFVYTPKNQNVTSYGEWADKLNGTTLVNGDAGLYTDHSGVDPNHKKANFIINTTDVDNRGTGYGFTITDNSYVGFYQGRSKYYILRINADTMLLSQTYADRVASNPAEDGNARTVTYVRKK